jgi:ABC-type nitrate/sulfonate/bicarbonate transport system permease component
MLKKASARPGRRGRLILTAIPIILAATAWELVTRLNIVNALFLPPLSRVLEALWQGLATGVLSRAVLVTALRFLSGYVAAAFIGISLGFFMGRYRLLSSTFGPLVEVIRPIPSAALIPLAILFLGIQDEMKIAIVTVGSLWPILLNTWDGVREVDPLLIDTGRTLGLRPWQIDLKLVFPATLPFVFAGLRISLAVALLLALTVEMISGDSGLGYIVIDSERSFGYPAMYAGILLCGIMGLISNYIFEQIQDRVLFWSNRHLES